MSRTVTSSQGSGTGSITPTVAAPGRRGLGLVLFLSLDGHTGSTPSGWTFGATVSGGVYASYYRNFSGTEAASVRSPTITCIGPLLYVTSFISYAATDAYTVELATHASIPTSLAAHQVQDPSLSCVSGLAYHYIGSGWVTDTGGGALTSSPDAPLTTPTESRSGTASGGSSQLLCLAHDIAFTPSAGFSLGRTFTVTGDSFNPSGIGIIGRDVAATAQTANWHVGAAYG